jgi:lipoate-protein ligase A
MQTTEEEKGELPLSYVEVQDEGTAPVDKAIPDEPKELTPVERAEEYKVSTQ